MFFMKYEKIFEFYKKTLDCKVTLQCITNAEVIKMTIKEVEQALSVSRANIRFYEKEGLLTANRKSNNYRDYTEENLRELKKIILFRS